MLDSTYKKALEKKQEIKKAFNRDLEDIKIDPNQKWEDHNLYEVEIDFTISGGDGSYNQKKFISHILYAVDAECLIYDGNKLNKIESSEVNVIPPYRYVRDILRNYMSLFEIKNSYQAFNDYNVDISLFDGSILGNMIRPSPVENELKTEIKDKIKEKYRPELEDIMKNAQKTEISSSKLFKQLKNEFSNNKIESMIYLENLEHLLALGGLLKETKNLVSISKTSIRNDYFNLNIPDIAIFENYCKKEGYSHPLYQEVNKTVKRDFPIMNKFFRDLKFTVFYCRLEDYKNVLKIELPYKAGKKDIEEILEKIKGVTAEGYPYLLKKAHNDVVIKTSDMERINKILDLMQKTGRDML
ncbi:MAG: DNA double-strand break repair nuclease NurA [Methanomicrobiales archaeon]